MHSPYKVVHTILELSLVKQFLLWRSRKPYKFLRGVEVHRVPQYTLSSVKDVHHKS